jgi:hypothetical protein
MSHFYIFISFLLQILSLACSCFSFLISHLFLVLQGIKPSNCLALYLLSNCSLTGATAFETHCFSQVGFYWPCPGVCEITMSGSSCFRRPESSLLSYLIEVSDFVIKALIIFNCDIRVSSLYLKVLVSCVFIFIWFWELKKVLLDFFNGPVAMQKCVAPAPCVCCFSTFAVDF